MSRSRSSTMFLLSITMLALWDSPRITRVGAFSTMATTTTITTTATTTYSALPTATATASRSRIRRMFAGVRKHSDNCGAAITITTRMFSTTPSDGEESTSELRFGLMENSSNNRTSASIFMSTNSPTILPTTTAAQFGDVMPLKRPNPLGPMDVHEVRMKAKLSSSTIVDPLTKVKQRNSQVAFFSIALACFQYLWQYLHPLEPISLLYDMQQTSSPMTVIGTTDKPTVVDFWAPWCENCKQLAPTLYQVEQTYSSSINFVMINGDSPEAWPLLEAFGVDAIPHLALVEADGTVDTALIGVIPKQWLIQDLDVLLENAKERASLSSSVAETSRQPLPFQMLDVFANRPDQRRIQVVAKPPPSP